MTFAPKCVKLVPCIFSGFPSRLCCAFSLATSDALTKKALAARHNEYLTAWVRLLLMVPPLVIVLLANPVPPLGAEFFPTILTALPIELLALILYFKALKLSPLGLTVPFLALTPVFLIVIPYLLLGERITLAGGAGIILIAAGSYTLNLHNRSSGLLAPFRSIFRERGSLCMIGGRRTLRLYRHPRQEGDQLLVTPLLRRSLPDPAVRLPDSGRTLEGMDTN